MLFRYLLVKMAYILYGQNQHDWINTNTLGKGVLQSNHLPSAVRANRFCRMFNCVRPALQWRYDEHDGVSTHQPYDCLPTVYSGADHRRHQSSASLAFVRGIQRWSSPHKVPVTRKMFPFDDAIMGSGRKSSVPKAGALSLTLRELSKII